MTSGDYSPSVTNTPGGSSVRSTPVRQPPAVYLSQQNHSHSLRQSQTREHLETGHGSVSSASTGSSRQTTPGPPAGSIHIYSPTFSLSSGAEEGTLGTPRPSRAYPTQYTRPSRGEMAEINAAYRHSYDKDDASEEPKDHAIWIMAG